MRKKISLRTTKKIKREYDKSRILRAQGKFHLGQRTDERLEVPRAQEKFLVELLLKSDGTRRNRNEKKSRIFQKNEFEKKGKSTSKIVQLSDNKYEREAYESTRKISSILGEIKRLDERSCKYGKELHVRLERNVTN